MTTQAIAKTQDSPAARFTGAMMREFSGIAGAAIELSPEQKRLAQHLFLKIDESLKSLEAKRLAKGETNRQPIIWQNVNMQKLAMDAMRRVELGLDALIENHISPIPYWNARLGKYDLDLRVGYVGKDYYRRRFALHPPKRIIYELVYSTDVFKLVKKSAKNPVETYELEVTKPWDRGEIVGGFAYLMYEDETQNQLIPVPASEFDRSERLGNKDFWKSSPVEMKYKTIVNRAMARLWPDPEKTPDSFHIVEAEFDAGPTEEAVAHEIAENANREELPPLAALGGHEVHHNTMKSAPREEPARPAADPVTLNQDQEPLPWER
jgi:recombination protein RecT